MADEVVTPKRPTYGVKLVRGPFVDLPPHAGHCLQDSEFLQLAQSIRDTGTPLAADLFAGAGGMSLGLQGAGYQVVLGVDHYDFAVDTHAHHFPGLSLNWDLADPEAIKKISDLIQESGIELLAGGPPCQPFSKAGRSIIRHRIALGQRDPEDQRRDLWRSFLEVIQLAKPKAVLMENVPDMALDREMFILRSIVEELEQEGYSVSTRVIETWQYGVPQMRQRLLIVALRDGIKFQWPENTENKVTLWNAIGDLPDVEGGWRPPEGAFGWAKYHGPITQYQKLMRTQVPETDKNKVFDHITRPVREDDRLAFESMTHETKYGDLPPELQRYRKDIFSDKYKRLDENDLSRTITAHIAKDGYSFIHPREARTLTVREAARIQSFPDHFRFSGPPTAAFTQIGNAVPPLVSFAVGTAIRNSLSNDEPGPCSSREISTKIADWYLGQRESTLSVPWLRSGDRWLVIASEILLDRATSLTVRAIWPVISGEQSPRLGSVISSKYLENIIDLATTVGREAQALRLKTLATEVQATPNALWSATIDREVLPSISQAVADLAELAAPTTEPDGTESEEPVLVTRGVLRVASRYQGNTSDRRNKLTDGRLAMARMIGIGDNSRIAHLGIIEIANSICRTEDPICSSCPLRTHCCTANSDAIRPSLF